MNFIHNESVEKLRGGYYTPADLALFASRWVAHIQPERVLEPSCGDGAFLEALSHTACRESEITAVEYDPAESLKARARAGALALNTKVLNQDFLGWAIAKMKARTPRFDAVVGNPPFIRYQYLPSDFQVEAEQIFSSLGCKFTKHTNAWVPFVLASIELLRPGGRLSMVVPSEIIHVLHAQSLRTFLMQRCRKTVLIDPEEIWFEGTLQGAVLLLAEKKQAPEQSGEGLGLVSVRGRDFVNRDPEEVFTGAEGLKGRVVETKWTRAFLGQQARDLLDDCERMTSVSRFTDVAEVDVGIVTGANKFFLVDDETVEQFDLQEWAHPMFGRSEHCPGVVYDDAQHARNRKAGLPANFLWFSNGDVQRHKGASSYIKQGELELLHTRYKCRIRKPWYTVPSVYSREVGMLKRCHTAPKLILNRAGAFTTDTAYRVAVTDIQPSAFVGNFLNPMTALSAELEGRTYGGGVLELVPSEIERLLVPTLRKSVCAISEVDRAMRKSIMIDVQEQHGTQVLKALGMTSPQRQLMLESWIKLMNRRQRTSVADNSSVDLD